MIFFAGFTFLIYEVSWNRLLSFALGATVAAATIVLAAFMAGIGWGALYWGRRADRARRSHRLLAALLAGTGLWGLFSHPLFADLLPSFYAKAACSGLSPQGIDLIAFGISGVALLIPAFLMGGTFPLICKLAVRPPRSVAATLGRLYALETLGSALGGLLAGFLFLGLFGQRNTLFLAALIDFALAAGLLAMPAGEAPPVEIRSKVRHGHTRALIGTFICGLAILSLQVFWIRMLRIYLTNTSYTFALVSSLVILGLFLGSVAFERTAARVQDYSRALGGTLLWLGLSAGLGLILLIHLPQIFMFPFERLLTHPLLRILLLPMVAALFIIVPPAIFSGYAFPLACRLYVARGDRISGEIGLVLMANTVGAVLGPLLAAFVLLPWLGAARGLLLIVMLLAGTALYLLRGRPGRPAVPGLAYVVLAATLILILTQPNIRILPPSFARFDREVLYYRESIEGTLSVGRDRSRAGDTKYTYVNNSAVIGSTYDAVKVVKMVGHLPFFAGLACEDVLVIGFGIGVTTSAIAAHPEVASIECVELIAGMDRAARYYRDLNHNVMEDPRLTLITGDGRHYLQRTAKTYDLISCDPTHPVLGSGNLYTRDYFALCKAHLNPGGMVSQYLPLHKLRPEDFLGLIGTFQSVFPHATVWLGHYHAVLLAALEPIEIDFVQWANRIAETGHDPHFYSDPHHLAAALMFDSARIAELTAARHPNTDDRSYTEFFAPASLDPNNLSRNLDLFVEHRAEIGTVFGNIADPARMASFVEGNRLLTESLYFKMRGDDARCIELLERAAQINPANQEYPFLLRLYAIR